MELNLTVDVTADDFREYLRFAQDKAKLAMSKSGGAVQTKFLNMLIWMFIGLALTLLANWSEIPIHFPSVIGSAIVAFIVCFTQIWWYSKKLQEHMLPEQDGIILGRHQYHFRHANIEVRSQYVNSVFQWKSVRSIEETQLCLFLILDRCHGLILPKRTFAGETTIANFKAQVLEQIGHH